MRKAAETSAAADQPTTPAQHDPATGNAEALTESLLSSHITDCSTPVAEHAAQAATGQPANPVQEETPEAGLAVDADGQQPMCPSIPGILTEVREREVLAAAAPAPPPSAPAFPAAVHRKQSKVNVLASNMSACCGRAVCHTASSAAGNQDTITRIVVYQYESQAPC